MAERGWLDKANFFNDEWWDDKRSATSEFSLELLAHHDLSTILPLSIITSSCILRQQTGALKSTKCSFEWKRMVCASYTLLNVVRFYFFSFCSSLCFFIILTGWHQAWVEWETGYHSLMRVWVTNGRPTTNQHHKNMIKKDARKEFKFSCCHVPHCILNITTCWWLPVGVCHGRLHTRPSMLNAKKSTPQLFWSPYSQRLIASHVHILSIIISCARCSCIPMFYIGPLMCVSHSMSCAISFGRIKHFVCDFHYFHSTIEWLAIKKNWRCYWNVLAPFFTLCVLEKR